jgi:lipopolysaccharide/colanic/teichoic acid biosynthesis glycosyltransferase
VLQADSEGTTDSVVVPVRVHGDPRCVTATGCSPLDTIAKRALDIAVSACLLAVLLPLFIALAIAIKAESRGPVFYRARRVGRNGRPLDVLKFRKMVDGARGPALTVSGDSRLTRTGRFIAETKLDELPQLFNVLGGSMSLVGPRPEDAVFVALHQTTYRDVILRVRPGITGVTQLAFVREGALLDPHDRVGDYETRLLPRKVELDLLYVQRRSVWMDMRILYWTIVAIVFSRDVAVNRKTAGLSVRHRPIIGSVETADTPTAIDDLHVAS